MDTAQVRKTKKAALFIESQKDVERRAIWEGNVYVIRDRWVLDGSHRLGIRLDTCEYAVKDDGGLKAWKPCREGVSFAEIEPYEAA